MPLDFILKSGDMLEVSSPVIDATIPQVAAPVPLVGSSTDVKISEMPACILGDELPEAISGPLAYTTPSFPIPGTGTLQIVLNPNNLTVMTKDQGTPLLLKGNEFEAIFNVEVPAEIETPTGPVPDPVAVKVGAASFITTNETIKAQ